MLIEFLSSALGGSALGAVAAAVGRWQQGKQELEKLRLQQAHELALAKAELQQAKALADVELIKSTGSTQVESYTHDAMLDGMGFVGAVRALVRPMLTAFLVICTALIGLQLASDTQLDPVDSTALLKQIVDGLVSCTSMALAWWFGARSHIK